MIRRILAGSGIVFLALFAVLTVSHVGAQDDGAAPPLITIDNAAQLKPLQVLKVPEEEGPSCVAWSPDGAQLGACGNGGKVWLWDTVEWEQTNHDDEGGGVHDMAWSPDGSMIATGNRDTSGRVWDVETGTELFIIGDATLMDDAFARCDNLEGMDMLTCLGNVSEVLGDVLDELSFKSVEWSPDGSILAAGTANAVGLWDGQTGAEIGFIEESKSLIWSIDWSADGSTLAAGSIEDLLIISEIDKDNATYASNVLDFAAQAVAWGPEGQYLAIGTGVDVAIVDFETLDVITEMPGEGENYVLTVAWSPDGTLLASGDTTNTVRIWNAQSGEQVAALTGHSKSIEEVAWSPDGTLLASAAFDNTIRIWGVPDIDEDGIVDPRDNCPRDANPDQLDTDEDGFGDVCDACPGEAGTVEGCPDGDDDGIADASDNCPAVANPDQDDFDDDGTGDACQDTDEDGFMDADDDCPEVAGTVAGCPDGDEDGFADKDDDCPDEPGTIAGCPDGDDDGVADINDNCPAVANADQDDFNDDGTGDACQDSDEDSFLDIDDECPAEAGTIAGCPDSDEDGFADKDDECPDEPGTLEGCPDSDEDGIADKDDECPDEWGLPEVGGCLFTGTVSNNVNLRAGPGTNFDILAVTAPGDELSILGRNEAADWLRIRTIPAEDEEPVEAWIAAFLLTTDAPIDALPVVEE